MSKIINSLTPEDFGKSFDMALFSEWKKSVEEHEKASIITWVLLLIGMLILIIMPAKGFFDSVFALGSYFVLALIGIGISLPKMKKRNKYQKQLGISYKDLKNAIAAKQKQMKQQ
jgi:uncharacterized membrane protein